MVNKILSPLFGIYTLVQTVQLYCILLKFKCANPITQQFHFYGLFLQRSFQSSQRYVDKGVYLQRQKRKTGTNPHMHQHEAGYSHMYTNRERRHGLLGARG